MLCLSQDDIEVICESVLRDYAKESRSDISIYIDIERFAHEYLELDVHYRPLSDNGSILGLTTYKGAFLELALGSKTEIISVPADTILLEEKLLKPECIAQRRFTVAHECAHQILARLEEKRIGTSFRKRFNSAGKRFNSRELKSAEDWCEWQANSLGAALLMPREELLLLVTFGFMPVIPAMFGGYYSPADFEFIKKLADWYNVSQVAMAIRLKELGLIEINGDLEYASAESLAG